MINTEIRIHDKFSVEFKIGFVTNPKLEDKNEFKINTWIFVPNGLDINRSTYTKEQFYADVKSNIRLITPVYSLNELLEGKGPFHRLRSSIVFLTEDQHAQNIENYVYQMKMLLCIVKSALREASLEISREKEEAGAIALTQKYIEHVRGISTEYRSIRDKILENTGFSDEIKEYMLFGDEFLGNVTEFSTYRVMQFLRLRPCYKKLKAPLTELIDEENANKQKMGFGIPVEGDDELNSLILIKRNLLKKFVESDLYLQTVKKKDGAFAREFYYSLAAGLAMIFATFVSFFATIRYGNFTSTLFFILVLSYMFKDRIKETARYYFSSKLDRKYFDHKWKLSIRNQEIGWIKEGFDFIEENSVPQDIINLRNKTPLVKAENRVYDEKIILFRKRVCLSKEDIEKYKEYHLSGINDIIRLNLTSFIKKMDNPASPIYMPDEVHGYKTILGHRVYALYFILQCESDDDIYYRKYRLLFNRNGITDVSQID